MGTPGTATTTTGAALSPPRWLSPQEDSVAVVGLEEKLQQCEKKLQFLKERVAARPEDTADEHSEVQGLPSVPLGTHRWPPKSSFLSKATGKSHEAAQPQMAPATPRVPRCGTLGLEYHLPSST